MPFSHIIPPSPSPSESKSPLYTSVSFLLSCIQGHHCHLSKFHIYVSILYWCFSFWLTSLCIIGSSFIHLIRTDSNVFFLTAVFHPERALSRLLYCLDESLNWVCRSLPSLSNFPHSYLKYSSETLIVPDMVWWIFWILQHTWKQHLTSWLPKAVWFYGCLHCSTYISCLSPSPQVVFLLFPCG